VAAAAQVTTLSTRASVLGVTNAKGAYDPRQSLSANTSLSGPLLSRFDIILVLRDVPNADWDARVSAHILSGHSGGCAAAAAAAHFSGQAQQHRAAPQDQVAPLPCSAACFIDNAHPACC
jgi:DNA replicative helicase MCM subunit Mcm2 (Cdc46/Mcm family)